MNFKREFLAWLAGLTIGLWIGSASSASAGEPVSDELAALAIVGEARGESFEGQIAVGEAIRHRGSLRGVYGLKAAQKRPPTARELQSAQKAWALSSSSQLTGGADHWENVEAFGMPGWARHMIRTVQIGHHTFFRSKNEIKKKA